MSVINQELKLHDYLLQEYRFRFKLVSYSFMGFHVENQVSEAKMIWVDRLGFDLRIYSPQKGIFDVRIPFPREVTDEKGAKSSFNGMSQLAWEVEKNIQAPEFQKVKQLKQVTYSGVQ